MKPGSFGTDRAEDRAHGQARDAAAADAPVRIVNPGGRAPVLLVCEHASNRIPDEMGDLGLSPEARESHVAWDPGALGVAQHLARLLDAPLVHSTVSRLVYDCNRPPEAPDAMPARSEIHDIPGNAGISEAERARRTDRYYRPFREALAGRLDAFAAPPALVTVHSFTPVFHGRSRDVELGILHDADSRLADALLQTAPGHTGLRTRRNEPYAPKDGVTHTLRTHALPRGLPNAMLEIRNDLIDTPARQEALAAGLAAAIGEALRHVSGTEDENLRAGSGPEEAKR